MAGLRGALPSAACPRPWFLCTLPGTNIRHRCRSHRRPARSAVPFARPPSPRPRRFPSAPCNAGPPARTRGARPVHWLLGHSWWVGKAPSAETEIPQRRHGGKPTAKAPQPVPNSRPISCQNQSVYWRHPAAAGRWPPRGTRKTLRRQFGENYDGRKIGGSSGALRLAAFRDHQGQGLTPSGLAPVRLKPIQSRVVA
jgi:hypothetical protein